MHYGYSVDGRCIFRTKRLAVRAALVPSVQNNGRALTGAKVVRALVNGYELLSCPLSIQYSQAHSLMLVQLDTQLPDALTNNADVLSSHELTGLATGPYKWNLQGHCLIRPHTVPPLNKMLRSVSQVSIHDPAFIVPKTCEISLFNADLYRNHRQWLGSECFLHEGPLPFVLFTLQHSISEGGLHISMLATRIKCPKEAKSVSSLAIHCVRHPTFPAENDGNSQRRALLFSRKVKFPFVSMKIKPFDCHFFWTSVLRWGH